MKDRGRKLEANVWMTVDTEKIEEIYRINTKRVISKFEV